MLNSKRVARVTVIALLIVLGSLSQLPFQVPSVSAHEDAHVHPFMSREAAKLLPPGSLMHSEIEYYMDAIRYGSYNEDHYDWVYGDLTGQIYGIVAIPHFWDADKGPEDQVKGIPAIAPGPFPNAYQKALELFDMALSRYEHGDYSGAYELLGHVAHLIEDQTVPAHVHEDFHPAYAPLPDVIPGGDDSFEDWIYELEAYDDWEYGLAARAAGVIEFPRDVEEQMRQGNWDAGLYYLMYTTNQCADYFASDDVDGDTVDNEGWMDYSGWPTRPTRSSHLVDNDKTEILPGTGVYSTIPDNDNDNDGDLGTIASYSYVYGIRAVATLYKMFYEATHPPTASIEILAADQDDDGAADYRWVRLQVTYDVGAPEFYRDLEAKYKNENEDWNVRDWAEVGAQPGGRIVSWILSDGDGAKEVSYRIRNLMGLEAEVSATIELRAWGMPQLFHYSFTATGAQSVSVTLDFLISQISIFDDPQGIDFVWFTLDLYVTDENGNVIASGAELPALGTYAVDVPVMIYPGEYVYTQVPVGAGDKIRLETSGWDHLSGGRLIFLGGVDSDLIEVPRLIWDPGTHTAWIRNQWYYDDEYGDENMYYEIKAGVKATYDWVDAPRMYEDPPYPFNPTHVEYGEPYTIVASSTLEAPVKWTTQWEATVDNPDILYYMDGPNLKARTAKTEADLVVTGHSPVHLLITDPDGKRIGMERYWTGFYMIDPVTLQLVPVYSWRTINEIPGASVVRKIDWDRDGDLDPIDLDGDGYQDTIIVFDNRKVGNYTIQVSPKEGALSTDTYTIGISSPALPQRTVFLSQDIPLAEMPTQPLVLQSTPTTLNLPPTADAGGPYTAVEGTTINFNASGSTDPNGDSLTYRWDFEDDGIWDTPWSSSPTASHTWNDDWTGTARVEVSDGALTDTATVTVTVSNAAPTVNAGLDQIVAPGEEVHFSGSFTDPGVVDTHTIIWDFGDSTTATDTLTPTHIYSEAKKYTVTLTVTDDDGGVGIDTLTVNTGVEVSINPLSAVVQPGENTTYNVLIHHLGNTGDKYNLSLGGLDATWYSLSTTSVTLGPGQSKSVTLTVSPSYVATIRSYGFTVVATSQAYPTVLGTADADAIVWVPIEVVGPLDVEVDVGSIHYRGETAEFYILVSSMGEPIDANISAILRAHGTLFADLSASVEHVHKGLYRVPYTIPTDAPTGTYVLVVEAGYLTVGGTSLKCFLLRARTKPTPAWVIAATVLVVAVVTGIALYRLKIRKPRKASQT